MIVHKITRLSYQNRLFKIRMQNLPVYRENLSDGRMIVIADIIPFNQLNHIAYIHSASTHSCFSCNSLQLFIYICSEAAGNIREKGKGIISVIIIAEISDVIMYHTVMMIVIDCIFAVCFIINNVIVCGYDIIYSGISTSPSFSL